MRSTTHALRALRPVALLLAVGLVSVAARAADEWPCFQHDPANTGYSTSDGPEDGDVVWQFDTGGNVRTPPAIVAGKVYFGSEDGHVYCCDASSGELIWSYNTDKSIWDSGPAIVDERLYIATSNGYVYCLDAVGNGDGSTDKLWDTQVYGEVTGSPAVAEGRLVIGDWDDVLSCLDASDGTPLWAYQSKNKFFGSPAIVDGKVYAGATDLYCFPLDDPNGDGLMQDSEAIWIHDLPQTTQSSPTIVAGKLYIGCDDGFVYCFDAAGNGDGTTDLLWSYETGGPVYSSPALWENHMVYVGSNDGSVYALHASDGELEWEYATTSAVNASPCVTDQKVYVPSRSNDFKLYCLDANGNNDGTTDLIWVDTTKNYMECSPAAYAGKLYCGTYDDKLYCYSDSVAASSNTASVYAPIVVDFDLYGGPALADRAYIMLAGISGTEPGFDVFMGQTHVPLNIDGFTFMALDLLNSPIFVDFLGTFDGTGHAQARFDSLVPLGSSAIGFEMFFAWLTLSPRDTASVPATILFTD